MEQPVQDLDIIALLTRPGTYVLAVAIFIATLFVRRVVENIWPSLKKQHDENSSKVTYLTQPARWWNTVILAALPVLFGALAGLLIKSDFFFDGIGDKGGRLAFGGGAGWFSGVLYALLKKLLKQRFGLEVSAGDSDAPPPPSGP